MKKQLSRNIAVALCCCALFLGSFPTAQAASLKASIVTGKVTLNGQVIDNKTAKYPLLLYSNITYFPMTYHLSRFMGVSTDWNNDTKTLNITAGGERTAYVAETGKRQSGSVSVTLPTYKTYVNGAYVNNKEAIYPIFNYNGATYFPLTWAYAVDAFGWGYQWDAVNGLRIDTTTASAPASTDPNTGNADLDRALTILNDSYASGGTYSGTLSGKGEEAHFDAALKVTHLADASIVDFTAEPFPFFAQGHGYLVTYYPKDGGFAGERPIGYSGEGTISNPLEVYEASETVYIGKCFLDCQFTGERSKRITDATKISSSGNVSTWELTVSFTDGKHTGYIARVSVDTAKSAVSEISIRTANYTLTMTPN